MEDIKDELGKGQEITKSGGGRELTASEEGQGPDPGGGQRLLNLVEDMNSQRLIEDELTASGAMTIDIPFSFQSLGHSVTFSFLFFF